MECPDVYLPLANIMHHKSRSLLCAGGIGIATCMLVALTGLSRGSLYEIAERMESVDAELIVVPPGTSSSIPTLSGIKLHEKIAPRIENDFPDLVRRAVPAFIYTMKLAGQDQRVIAVSPNDWGTFSRDHEIVEGRLFDPENRFGTWLEQFKTAPADDDEVFELTPADLSDPAHDGMEIVIDQRLADAGGYRCGQTVTASNHEWTITGIVETGVTTRIFMPLRTAQELFGIGDITKCTMIFVKLNPLPAGMTESRAAEKIGRAYDLDVMPMKQYRGFLEQKFGILFTYVDAVNIIALSIAFLFVTSTLYTMVLQQRREIAILKSCGAGPAFLISQVVAESIMITGTGAAAGIGGSFAAGWAIETVKPLLTVDISMTWIVTALAAALLGALLSAIYPAWQALRTDMVEAMRYE